eukprot:1743243-Amphidinium_carterae.1
MSIVRKSEADVRVQSTHRVHSKSFLGPVTTDADCETNQGGVLVGVRFSTPQGSWHGQIVKGGVFAKGAVVWIVGRRCPSPCRACPRTR